MQNQLENAATSISQAAQPYQGSEIVIEGLVKDFGDVTAVNGLNLEIRKGEFFGFLGPNGAGKTTTISILCGLLAPTAGAVHIGGLDIRTDMQRIKERIGVCPQESAAFKFLTGRENITLFGELHGMEKQALKARVDDLLRQNRPQRGSQQTGERLQRWHDAAT